MNTSKNSPLPRRGQRFADAVLNAIWVAILALPVAMQHLLLDELRKLLARNDERGSHAARRQVAISALRECAELVGHSPSVGDYRSQKAEHPEFDWPADSTLRTWLGGSWNDCLRAAQLPAVPDGDVIVVQLGQAITDKEAVAALRACTEELGTIPTLHAYLAWTRRPDVAARAGRRPQSQGVFHRIFGGFPQAIVAAGLTNEGAVEVSRRERLRVASYYITDEICAEALQRVAAKLGRSPRVHDYVREREALLDEPKTDEHDDGLKALPAPSTIQKRFGTWDAALEAAGLEPLGGRSTGVKGRRGQGRKGPQIKTEEAIACLVEAYEAKGDPFTGAAYRAWRTEQIKRDREERRLRKIPSYDVVWTRFGNWTTAVSIIYRAIRLGKRSPQEIASAIDEIVGDHLGSASSKNATASAPEEEAA
jgi:Homing endonuclease associated repeat